MADWGGSNPGLRRKPLDGDLPRSEVPRSGVQAKTYLEEIEAALAPHLSAPTLRALLACAARVERTSGPAGRSDVLRELRRGVSTFARGDACVRRCLEALERFDPVDQGATLMDLTDARQMSAAHAAVRRRCDALGFPTVPATKIATAAMEMVRNAIHYGGGGTMSIDTVKTPRLGVEIVIVDRGGGIPNLGEILEGRYRSRTGMGAGIRGARALADAFDIETGPTGTRVRLCKYVD
jgi:serine/threonine-protein kinase RsbT